MKKIVLIFIVTFSFSTAFTSCRETNEERTRIEANDDLDNLENDVEKAADDVGNSIERAAQDVEDEIERNDDL